MRRALIAGAVLAGLLVLVVIVLAAGRRIRADRVEGAPGRSPATLSPSAAAGEVETTKEAVVSSGEQQGFLYGRVTADNGVTYEGRLRWGGNEEAFWSDYFIGFKDENAWAAFVAPESLPSKRVRIEFLGLGIANRKEKLELGRPFMRRLGEIARIEPHDRDIRVTLKGGSVVALDRFSYGDWDDGVRVWDAERGVVDLEPGQIRAIELLPTGRLGDVSERLRGTVHTPQGDFSGFLQWGRRFSLGADEMAGYSDGKEIRLRFDTLRSITPRSDTSFLLTLLDGREVLLTGTQRFDQRNNGTYVDDPRYGRVLISPDGLDRVDFDPIGFGAGDASRGSGPAYGDFALGRPLTGSVTTRGGRLAGRLVFDLDESETTDTLDAPSLGVDYSIPFGRVTSIARSGGGERGAALFKVTLEGGEELRLDAGGDLGEENAGMLVFVEGAERPQYVPWGEVERVELDRLPTIPPAAGAQ